ncbi:MAG: hypothetical protein FWD91_02050, partial [Treponema sp.]|nr:hypothetical protein [Treponema sp.]
MADKATAIINDIVKLTLGTPHDGYAFDMWVVTKPSGLEIGAGNTFAMPASDVEVMARWKAIDYTITVHQGGGSGSTASKGTAFAGDPITLTPGNRADDDFAGWAVVPANVSIDANHTFTIPASHVEITANWHVKPSGVTITSTHILTAQGMALAFDTNVTPQHITWSVAGNDKASFSGNVLNVAADAKPGATITVTVTVNGYPQLNDERTLTILRSTA